MKQEDSPSDPTITVVGVGLMGASLALALRRAGHRGTILGVSRPGSLDEARRLGAIDEGFPYAQLAEAASRSDLVILASPISRIVEHLEVLGRAAEQLRPGAMISDVGSTKQEILRTAQRCLPETVHFVGGHPLAGSERRGAAAADPFLFQNAYYVLTPADTVPWEETDRLARLVQLVGARPVVLSAEQHDRIAAAISHLPQLLAVTLVNSLDALGENREHGIHLAAGGFRDMTRIASSPFSVWRDILRTNQTEILGALDTFVDRLKAEAKDFDETRLDKAFEKAAQTRGEIPRDTKGFLSQLWDLLVEVEDTPGVIASLVNPLAEKGINVKDIEVLKVREGEGGTMRLAFATQELALEAMRILKDDGFKARLRE